MNERDQTRVAYEDGPKEVNEAKKMPWPDVFPGNKMPNVNRFQKKVKHSTNGNSRHKEYR
jgi:hypothetical protein